MARYSDSRQSQCSQCEAKLRSWRWLVSGPFIFRAIRYCSTWEIFILDPVLYDVVCQCKPWFGGKEEVSMLSSFFGDTHTASLHYGRRATL